MMHGSMTLVDIMFFVQWNLSNLQTDCAVFCSHSAAQTHPAEIIAPPLSKVHIYRLFGLADDDICHWELEEWG